jgi:hypothetical protein
MGVAALLINFAGGYRLPKLTGNFLVLTGTEKGVKFGEQQR